jgi:hypothetical protein
MNDSQGGYVLNGTPISGVSAPQTSYSKLNFELEKYIKENNP